MLHDLSDQEFIHLVFTSQDRLGAGYLEEAKGRRETIVPLLCAVLTDEENYRRQDEGLWSVIHGVNILGILGNTRALEAVRAPEAELARHGFSPYFEPIFNQIDFTGDDEFGEFIRPLQEYCNALAHQQHAVRQERNGIAPE